MSGEQLQKYLQLLGGIVAALGGIIGGGTELFHKVGALPPWLAWPIYAALTFGGVWLLAKYRTRYSRLVRADALRLDRNRPDHLVGRQDDVETLVHRVLAYPIVFL